jgi:N-acylneuraminate cytidylyltransferase
MKTSVAIITARGGSKRIPRKNLKLFLGKPIISYVIEAALRSKVFSEVMVSTDDKEIASLATKFGAKVPFFRSNKSSDNHATTADVILEVLNEYNKRNIFFSLACCMYPTAPFVTSKLIKESRMLLMSKHADSVIPIVRYGPPIQRAIKKDIRGMISFREPNNAFTRTQDLEPFFHDAGQFYWLNIESFKKQRKIFMEHTIGLEVSDIVAHDIDTLEDWRIAEMKYRLLE